MNTRTCFTEYTDPADFASEPGRTARIRFRANKSTRLGWLEFRIMHYLLAKSTPEYMEPSVIRDGDLFDVVFDGRRIPIRKVKARIFKLAPFAEFVPITGSD